MRVCVGVDGMNFSTSLFLGVSLSLMDEFIAFRGGVGLFVSTVSLGWRIRLTLALMGLFRAFSRSSAAMKPKGSCFAGLVISSSGYDEVGTGDDGGKEEIVGRANVDF